MQYWGTLQPSGLTRDIVKTLVNIYFYLKEPLGVLFKNENLNDEMIDILQYIHDHYLPCEKVVKNEES